jgi:2-(1,2-epoxy-1,2-dihydrophenyl)acetyl-CoA isomerase
MEMYETILYAAEAGVATITLNRPEVMNACNETLLKDLLAALKQAEQAEDVRVVVLTGAGRAFCAGADLAGHDPRNLGDVTHVVRERWNPLVVQMQTMRKPILAAVNGVAAGAGFAFALAADLRVASEHAKFSMAFCKIGLAPDSGASYFLPRLVGIGKAMELALTGEVIDATEAARLGVVSQVVPADRFEAAVREFAQRLAAGPTYALGLTKRAIYQGAESDLLKALETEAQYQGMAAKSSDFREGVRAFLEKRAPRFEGK